MDINIYQAMTLKTAIYPQDKAIEYLSLGLTSEVGEVMSLVKKSIRGDYSIEDKHELLRKELGDVFWYLVRICDELGYSVESVLEDNIIKLADRQRRDAIMGDGDDR